MVKASTIEITIFFQTFKVLDNRDYNDIFYRHWRYDIISKGRKRRSTRELTHRVYIIIFQCR